MIKALIIEDELLIAKQLENKIAKIRSDIQIMEILPSIKLVQKWFTNNSMPDLIFMDIQLNDGLSFELFELFEMTCPVIFTTAYDEYALRAFKVHSIDYLLKPVDIQELENAINMAEEKILALDINKNSNKGASEFYKNPKQTAYKQKFIVNFKKNLVPIETDEIAMFFRDQLIYIHTFSGEKFIAKNETLDDIESLLDPSIFYRANRQAIVNIKAVKSFKPQITQKVILHLIPEINIELEISREKAPSFKKWFDR